MQLQRLLLMSGLSLERKHSFFRQLTLFARFMERRGIETCLAGPLGKQHVHPHSHIKQDPEGVDLMNALIKKTGVQAAVLLGYADQFPFLQRMSNSSFPVFLWAQVSNLIDPSSLGNTLPVPLTVKTASLLEKSGIKRIGPVIPHGVDCTCFHPLSARERQNARRMFGVKARFVIGTVGAHTLRKRLDRIIHAFSNFLQCDYDGALLIKTDRILSLEGNNLEALAKRLGVDHKVVFITRDLSDAEMNTLYNAMDLYLNLSEWEGFCIPVIEAMSCCIPVAAPPIQGPGEILPFRELLIEWGSVEREGERSLFLANPQEAAEILIKAFEHRALLQQLGERGRREAEQRYDIRIVAQRWEELISGVL